MGSDNNRYAYIIDYYCEAFPDDDLGSAIYENATFAGLYMTLRDKGDIYSYIGVADSVVRERVFSALAEQLGCEYDILYDMFLDCHA